MDHHLRPRAVRSRGGDGGDGDDAEDSATTPITTGQDGPKSRHRDGKSDQQSNGVGGDAKIIENCIKSNSKAHTLLDCYRSKLTLHRLRHKNHYAPKINHYQPNLDNKPETRSEKSSMYATLRRSRHRETKWHLIGMMLTLVAFVSGCVGWPQLLANANNVQPTQLNPGQYLNLINATHKINHNHNHYHYQRTTGRPSQWKLSSYDWTKEGSPIVNETMDENSVPGDIRQMAASYSSSAIILSPQPDHSNQFQPINSPPSTALIVPTVGDSTQVAVAPLASTMAPVSETMVASASKKKKKMKMMKKKKKMEKKHKEWKKGKKHKKKKYESKKKKGGMSKKKKGK